MKGEKAMSRNSTFTIFITIFLLIGCAPEVENNNTHGKTTKEENASESSNEQFRQQPQNENKQAINNLVIGSTKNITRIGSDSDKLIDTSIHVSQTIWPATHAENRPGTILLVAEDSWQIAMASANLIHHPNNGPILFIEENRIPNKTLEEIERLQPKGNENGTKIMVIGDVSQNVRSKLENYPTDHIKSDDPATFAANIDEKYANLTGAFPENVIIASSEEKGKLYSLPAVNWIAHMPEPVLYVEQNDIPKQTVEALKKRKKDALNIYILGPKSVVSNDVENDLKKLGNVTRIEGKNVVENAINFAAFKDKKTDFGWGFDEPGHGVSFISTSTPDLAIASAPLSHLGKHAPLIWLEDGVPNQAIYDFLAMIRPTFTANPQNGPYNHGFITGSFDAISFMNQGKLDEKLEIANEHGEGH